MSAIESFIKECDGISSDDEFKAFIAKYSFEKEEREGPPSQILGIYHGLIDGKNLTIKYRWYDQSRPFSIQPDMHCIKLTIDGYKDIPEMKFEEPPF